MPNTVADSKPFLSIRPGSLAPVVLTCEHATRRLPFKADLTAQERATLADHWGWDPGAWPLTRELARRLKTSAVGGRFSRLLIDLNRRVDEDTLIRRHAGATELSFNRSVSPAEVERRMLAYHAPYHLEIDRLILRRTVRGIRPLLFAVHSYTPVYEGRTRNYEIGVLFDRDEKLARKFATHLKQAGLSVRYNQPYSGKEGLMYSADRHGTHHDLPCLELEVNQGMFVGPNAERHPAERLGRIVAKAIQAII